MNAINSAALSATTHCLIGCGIGEVTGMVVGTAFGLSNIAVTVLAIILAFIFGYSLTTHSILRHGLPLRSAVGIALAADTLSITVMEIVDNGVIWLIPNAVHATLSQPLFWWSLGLGLFIAFIAAFPVNRWLLGRGKGHALVHAFHHTHQPIDDSHSPHDSHNHQL